MKKWSTNAFILSMGAWSVLMIGHEILGHGLATVLLRGEPLGVNGMYFEHDLSMLGQNRVKLIQASGSVFNICLAFAALFLFIRSPKQYWLKFFLWVTAVFNLLHSGSYIAFGRMIHPGMDWALILEDVNNRFIWELIETIIGLILIGLGSFVALKYGKELSFKPKRLFWIPISASTIAATGSSLLVPSDDTFMMLMGGIGNGFIFLFPLLILGFCHLKSESQPSAISKKQMPASLLVMSCLFICFYLFVMSPGLKF